MEKFKSNLRILTRSSSDDLNIHRYEQLLNQEMIGAGDSPITPGFPQQFELRDVGSKKQIKNSDLEDGRFHESDSNKRTSYSSTNRKNSGGEIETLENPFEIESLEDIPLDEAAVTDHPGESSSLQHLGDEPSDYRETDRAPMVDHLNQTEEDKEQADRIFKFGHTKVSFFSSKFKKEMKQIINKFVLIYMLMIVLVIAIGSIYYGTLFHRGKHLKDSISIDIVNDDIQTRVVKPLVGTALEFVTKNDKFLNSKVNFGYHNTNDFANYMKEHNLTSLQQALKKRISEKKSWAYVYVKSDASYNLYDSLRYNNKDLFDSSNVIHIYYQTARDQKITEMFLRPLLNYIEHEYQEYFQSRVMIPLISEWVDTDQQVKLLKDHKNILFKSIKFNYMDLHEVTDPVISAPFTVGLIMLIIVSFFQFNFFLPLHNLVSAKIQPRHYIYYRMISSQITYFFLGLGFTSIFYIFSQKKQFFFVYWLLTYLTIAAVGGTNENMALVLFVTFPPLVGFWLLFWVLLNISPSFNLIETLPHFYRYGYAMPIYNYLECLKVLVLDSWKGEVHKNILILLAWVAFNNLLFPFTIKFFSYRMARKMIEQEQQKD